MPPDIPLMPTVLIVALVVGHIIQVVLDRDDWPFSSYAMYAYCIDDRENNPWVPLRPGQQAAVGFMVLVAQRADGTSEPLTLELENALLAPFDRLRVLRQVTATYRKGGNMEEQLRRVADLVVAPDRPPGSALEMKHLQLFLYTWREVPATPQKNHPPDAVELIAQVDLLARSPPAAA